MSTHGNRILGNIVGVSNPVFPAIAAGGPGKLLTETMSIRFSLLSIGIKELEALGSMELVI